jgi:hypothetical protein
MATILETWLPASWYTTTRCPATARLGVTPGVTAAGDTGAFHLVVPVVASRLTSSKPPPVETYTTKAPPTTIGCDTGFRSLRTQWDPEDRGTTLVETEARVVDVVEAVDLVGELGGGDETLAPVAPHEAKATTAAAAPSQE